MKVNKKSSITILFTIALLAIFVSIANTKFANAQVFDGSGIGQPDTQKTHQGDDNLNNQQQTHQGDHNFNNQQFQEYTICVIC